MNARMPMLLVGVVMALSGCATLGDSICLSNCRTETRASSSLVEFLYPEDETPPRSDSIPELKLPLRVGLAFLPSQNGSAVEGLEAARRGELLERIRKRFSDRKFVSEIVIVPEYYLRDGRGFDGLAGVQRLYDIDLMALVSYDQVAYGEENKWSLGYLTIVGAYVLKGNRHDVTTLVDLAVVDPTTRSIVLRAGGSDTRHGTTTLVDKERETRETRTSSFSRATDQLAENFDVALTRFEADVKEGKAKVRVSRRGGGVASGGGGSFDLVLLLALAGVFGMRHSRRVRIRVAGPTSLTPRVPAISCPLTATLTASRKR
jgi:rhombotail lipoprotein